MDLSILVIYFLLYNSTRLKSPTNTNLTNDTVLSNSTAQQAVELSSDTGLTNNNTVLSNSTAQQAVELSSDTGLTNNNTVLSNSTAQQTVELSSDTGLTNNNELMMFTEQ
uniref:Uncharacterized protein LOC114335626 n=1 Tax=Diabrotica virgifera virgifera TaxID=50390 RepID=A0A6P7GA30_DIAVI